MSLLEKQNWKCANPYCINPVLKPGKYERDHKYPLCYISEEDKKNGSAHNKSNLQILCTPCHRTKGIILNEIWLTKKLNKIPALPPYRPAIKKVA